MFKRQKPNNNSHSSLRTGLKNLDHYFVNIDWFIVSDSSSLYRLQNTVAAERILMYYLFYSVISLYIIHVVLPECCHNNDWQIGAEKVGQFHSANHSPRECGVVCPVLSYLVFSCLYKLVFSFPVLPCHVLSCPILSCPFRPLLALGKGDFFPQTNTFLHTSWANANRMVCVPRYQPIPRRMQTPSANRLLHWMPTLERVCVLFLCTNTYSHPQRTSMCRN